VKGAYMSVRTTITFDEDILKLLKLKAVETSRSVSDLINELTIDAFREDSEDLRLFEERKDEESISFESFMKQLESDGKL
jgi:predicted CopG family antitoxin